MNVDPDKVKQLVLIFSELDEEYQKELMARAYTLQLMQSQKNLIQKENVTYKTEKELEAEIKRRSNKRAEESLNLVDKLEKMDDTGIATMIMLANRLAGKGNKVRESDISITINQKDVPMKEYLENYLSNADYDKAKRKVEEFLSQHK